MERFKLLIVDDELMIREGLSKGFQWYDWGFEIIGTAKHGKEALRLIEKEKPEVVLTDIRMPVMDGMELLNNLEGMNYRGEVIILSGYGDIDYYKKAIEYSVFDYILKPSNGLEVKKVFRKLYIKLINEKKEQQKLKEMKTMLEESIPLMKRNFLSHLLAGNIIDPKVVQQKLYFFGYEFQLDRYCVCRISYEVKQEGVRTDIFYQEHQCAAEQYIINYLNNYFKSFVDAVFFINTKQELVGLCATTNVHKLEKILTEVANVLHEKKGIYLMIGISDGTSKLSDISQQLERADQAYLSLMIEDDTNICIYQRSDDVSDKYFQKEINFKLIFVQVIASASEEPIEEIERFFDYYVTSSRANIEYINTVCYMIYCEFYRTGIRYGLVHDEDSCHHFRKQIMRLSRINSKKEQLYTSIWKFKRRLDKKRSKKNTLIIEMEAFIIRHLDDISLSLTMIAEYFGRNPVYLSAMYKKETGNNIQEYIKSQRLLKAKEYLQTTTMKIYEITEKVGYSDASYFNKIFRKDTGMSPIEYRKEGL